MPVVNPVRKVRCPVCFGDFYLSDCEVVSGRDGRVLHRKPQGIEKVLAQFYVPGLTGPYYNEELAAWRCPNCQALLPTPRAETHVIGLVGGVWSGKTHLLTSMIKTCLDGGLASLGCTEFKPLNDEVDRRFRQVYADPLFKDKQALVKTETTLVPPLIYELRFAARSDKQPGKVVNLVLFDVSGENIQHFDQIPVFAKYIFNAAGLIFIIDPLTISGVVDRLSPHLRPNPTEVGASAQMILSGLASVYRRQKPDQARIEIPVAVTVSKSDLLPYVRGGPAFEDLLFRPPPTSQGCAIGEFEVINRRTREFLTQVSAQYILSQAQATFAKMNLFTVSATGQFPLNETRQIDGRSQVVQGFAAIKPIRCLDPLVWLLWQMGIVECHGAVVNVPEPKG